MKNSISDKQRNYCSKIIFLDIDWVIVAPYTPWKSEHTFNKEKVELLKEIVKKTWAKIVITSNWKYRLDRLIPQWIENNLDMFIDTTIHHYWNNTMRRQEEILEWVFHNWVENYIVIDDCYWFWLRLFKKRWNLIKTKTHIWLTKEDVINAIELLNSK